MQVQGVKATCIADPDVYMSNAVGRLCRELERGQELTRKMRSSASISKVVIAAAMSWT